jgi:hypothetical protein
VATPALIRSMLLIVLVACTSRPGAGDARPNEVTLLAGDSAVNGSVLPIRDDTVRNAFVSKGTERSEGWVFERTVAALVSGSPALFRVVVGEMDQQVDTIFVDRRTLRPVWHRWHSPRSSGEVEYLGTRVRVRVAPTDSVPRAFEAQTPVPAFDGETIGLVRAALPFREGYTARIPVYDWHSGFQWRTATVAGRTTMKNRDAWKVVSVTTSGDRIEVFVDTETRATLFAHILLRSGDEVRMTR